MTSLAVHPAVVLHAVDVVIDALGRAGEDARQRVYALAHTWHLPLSP